MDYRYGYDWNPFTREAIDEITESQAREQWDKGPEFSVSRLQEGAFVPDWTLVLSPGGDYVRVTRYDEHGSTVQVEDFSQEEGGAGLFLG